jgi:large subunit ribosomal protein L18
MDKTSYKTEQRARRHNRIRAKVSGTAERPRLAIYRSNKAIYAQLINDETSTTIAAVDSRKAKGKTPRERARAVGQLIAEVAKKAGISAVIFDRGGFLYTGTVQELADGAREGGLTF